MSNNALTRYQSKYVAKKALFSFLGSSFRLFDTQGNLAFFVKQKAFKLKEQITVFGDEAQTMPMLAIQARSIMDISATYDVTDANSGENLGALKREGVKSIFRDEWTVLNASGDEIGKIKEDSGLMALVRRFLIKIIPQTYHVTIGDIEVGIIKQKFNPFQLGYDVDFSAAGDKLDSRMAVASVVLLLAIEGRQN